MVANSNRLMPARLEGYSADHPLLLLTDFPPETPGGGAVILQSLLGPAEREQIVWLTPARPCAAGRNVVWLRRGSAARTPKLGRSLWLDNTLMAGDLADEVLEIARERGAQAIWIVMDGAGVAIAARLARRTTVPIHLSVHDDPAFSIALASRRYLVLTPAIARDFARALRAAASVDVISEGMADRYLRRYGVRSVIVRRGLDRVIEPSPPYAKERLGLRVGILGNTYGYRQLLILGQAVAEAARKVGVPGRLLVVGAGHGERLRRDLAGQVEVEFTGHIDEAEAVRHLQRCFLLYLNYPFPAVHAVRRQTSFPTKLSTYVQAARPLLIHAPADSSLTPLGELTGYATCWDTPRACHGAAHLSRMWANPQGAESFHVAADRVRTRYFDLERNRRSLFDALNVLVPHPTGEEGMIPSSSDVNRTIDCVFHSLYPADGRPGD
jgi:glycosyltransferase involved in cell wall biosynthesis